MALDDYYAHRRKLVDSLICDLVGPNDEDEIINDYPTEYYISGMLFPRRLPIDPSKDNDAPDEDEDSAPNDPPVTLANIRNPSSMGMTFSVDSNITGKITISVKAAKYIRVDDGGESERNKNQPPEGDSEDETEPAIDSQFESTGRWQRLSFIHGPTDVDISKARSESNSISIEGLKLYIRIRPRDQAGIIPVTIVLLNEYESSNDRNTNEKSSFFQPEINVSANGKPAFAKRITNVPSTDDEDLRSYRLIYRNVFEFAIGHGCSVEWETSHNTPDRAVYISTTFTPEFDLPVADSNPEISGKAIEMKFLVTADRNSVIKELHLFCNGYDKWIQEQEGKSKDDSSLNDEQKETAQIHFNYCKQALHRIRRGIDLLSEKNDEENKVWQAFRYTNIAMLRQRSRSVWLELGKPGTKPDESSEHKWRPFQIAFILMCVEGIANPSIPDRSIADLLWFPTGGGKTEAYLGLIAFTIFLRRLKDPANAGITAIMRYTLRLLTIQQFERASLMICCCESVRRENPRLGQEPITVGVWLGQDTTPNTREQAAKSLDLMRTPSGMSLEKWNPIQLNFCPWCGKPLDHRNYTLAEDVPRLVVSCRNRQECIYSDGLPVYLVDDDIYDYRPSLIIATVDKFASLPWRDKALSLFNIINIAGNHTSPPELIIQDELHLISGPLGTMVGLYETILDEVCSREGVSPKIIASTATIRRAGKQIRGLFDREIRQFPPPGLNAQDTYFSVEAPPEIGGTRMYLGLMAPGKSHATLLIRTAASLLQTNFDEAAPNLVKDHYWTLVGYFNALRVLGAARLQVEDDVSARINYLANRRSTKPRPIDTRIELTSRVSTSDIKSHRKSMVISYPSPDPRPLDFVFATNMISVGFDVYRLGLMVVMGQPQSTSEYIQCTSRVGRRFPGLVVVLFNSAKSRDRSHYESFIPYHSSLYRQVESTSVTPFSARARDRGLHAVLVALVRALIPEMRDNSGAGKIQDNLEKVKQVKDMIVKRVQEIFPEEALDTERHLSDLITQWAELAKSENLVYRASGGKSKAMSLLIDPLDNSQGERKESFPTQWSLRDVDKEANLYIVEMR